MPSEEQARKALLDYVGRPDYRPATRRELLHRMQVPPERRAELRRLVDELLRDGRLARGRGGRLTLRTPDRVTGTLQRHRDGYGFVVTDDGAPDVFIAPPNLGSNLSGDRVAVRVTRRSRGNRLEGVVVRTVERRSRRILGVLSAAPLGATVQPFEAGLTLPVHVPESFRLGAAEGQVVSVEILGVGETGRPSTGKVLEVLGHLDDPGMDVRIVTRKHGLAQRFPDGVLEAAGRLPTRIGPRRARDRERFDDPPPVTIDGESARDFDDAVAVEKRPRGGFRLFVHIADVAEFVRPGDALDAEAQRRGTSVYFPHHVVPMFPERLSNELCSLRPGTDRLVQSVILDLDREGRVRSSRFADGIIRSAARLTYTQAARVIEGERGVTGVPHSVGPMLRLADRLSRLLEARRAERGSVDFDLPEPQLLLDVEGAMTGIAIEPRNRAHRLIEEFMLAANEAVARYLDRRIGTCVYRVHEAPDPSKLETLAHFLERFGLSISADPRAVGPGDFQQLLARAEGRPGARLIATAVLRSMRQARYSPDNVGHFSLASPCYCHYTSPIRRYPDLLVHRLLREARAGQRPPAERVRALAPLARVCSELERNAEAAERELLNWKKVAFVENRVGEDFEAIVTGVAPFGLFAQLEANLVEGLVRVERLGDERFLFDGRREELRGELSGRTYRLGDRLAVRVARVDRLLQRVDLAPAGPAPRKRRERGPGRRPGRRGRVVQ